MVLLIFVSILFISYASVIFFYTRSWKQFACYKLNTVNPDHSINFSVIIPARNEEDNICKLLEALQNQTYPKHLFEIIVVDDHSTDNTARLVNEFAGVPTNIKLVRLQKETLNSYKKKAIEVGIAVAQNNWIVCTDADCVVPKTWPSTYANFITENDPVFIAAPVCFTPRFFSAEKRNSALFVFQTLDFMTLQGITAASVFKKVHSMCNGANLAYKKDTFYEVNGFKGIDDIASGDDMLLMHKIWKKFPKKIAYLKSTAAIVETLAASTWKDFFNQRIRWASKAKHYDDKRIFWVLLLVYLFNFSFLVLAIASFLNLKFLFALLILWVAKTMIEFPFIKNVSKFFNQQELLKYFLYFQPLHIAYTIISGFLGSFGKYEWKGRKVK